MFFTAIKNAENKITVEEAKENIKKAGYDIKASIEALTDFYLKI